jgi:hypothetical protein
VGEVVQLGGHGVAQGSEDRQAAARGAVPRPVLNRSRILRAAAAAAAAGSRQRLVNQQRQGSMNAPVSTQRWQPVAVTNGGTLQLTAASSAIISRDSNPQQVQSNQQEWGPAQV